VTDAVTRLQRERDLALRRVDELHEHYKKELKKKDDADRRSTLVGMEQSSHGTQGLRPFLISTMLLLLRITFTPQLLLLLLTVILKPH
jgi:hypothetical protein